MPSAGKMRDVRERFNEKWLGEPNSGCWLWQGHYHKDGYGWLDIGSRTDGTRGQILAHRLSWQIHFGPIPDGLGVLHKCDTPPCVRPEHLFLGTQKANMTDAAAKQRLRSFNGAKTSCPRGHPYDVIDGGKKLSRRCRQCRNDQAAKRRKPRK